VDDNLPGSSKYPAFQFAKDEDSLDQNNKSEDNVALPNSVLHADPSNQMGQTQPSSDLQSTQSTNPSAQPIGGSEPFVKTQMQAHVIPNSTGPSNKPRSKAKITAMIVVVLFLISFAGTGTFAWGVAQNRIKLDKYPKVELAIKQVVFSIPGVPKSAEYLIARSYLAQEKVDKESYDISLAVSPDSQSDPLGLGNLDFQIKGDLDYSDPKNINFTSDIFLTKGLNVEVRKLNSVVYFNIKDVPAVILTAFGLNKDQFSPILNKWISWDITPLDTEARKMVQDQELSLSKSNLQTGELSKLLDPAVLDKISVTNSEVDGHKSYKLTLDADTQTVDTIQTILEEYSDNPGDLSVLGYTADTPKLSDFVKFLKIEAYIDKDNYYMRKLAATVSFEFDPAEFDAMYLGDTPPQAEKSKATIVYASLFDNFGEEITIEIPDTDMTSDEFLKQMSEIVSSFYQTMFNQGFDSMTDNSSITNDSKRLSAISTYKYSLEAYKLECGIYPDNLNKLTEQSCTGSNYPYIRSVFKDPDGSDYYYSSDGTTYDLCANFDNPPASTPCPDPSYNYHLGSESF
jgi:hypothetical protein